MQPLAPYVQHTPMGGSRVFSTPSTLLGIISAISQKTETQRGKMFILAPLLKCGMQMHLELHLES